jgi:hypothetical protein
MKIVMTCQNSLNYSDIGMVMEKRLPFLSSLRALISPPLALTKRLVMVSPRPMPPVAVVRDLSTSRSARKY